MTAVGIGSLLVFRGGEQKLDRLVKEFNTESWAPVPGDTASVAAMRDMDRWLGDGGMAIIGAIGAALEAYGVAEGGEGWAAGTWRPTVMACNPHGIVQAGVHGVILDAAMNFAVNASLDGRDRSRATLEMKTETMRVASAGDHLAVHGEVVRLARQVAYTEASVRDRDGRLISRATATFLLHREPPAAPPDLAG
jgi:uncharacterized protein (TIGR00369 family)